MINNEFEEKGNWIQHQITKLIILNPPVFGKSDYQSLSKYKNKLIFIEKNSGIQSADNYIPCLFYRNPKSSNYLIYFHGNSEHIFQIEYYGLDFRSYLDMNIIIVEYPGYSIYPCEDPESNIFFNNALIVYDWIKNRFQASDDQIFVCGRSLGTASAIFLSSKRKPKALFLISAFTSLKNIGKDFWMSYFVEQIFNSYRYISNISCPTLFVHGKKDSLINYHHSEQLLEEMKTTNNNLVLLKLNENMTHNDYDLKEDIIFPIKDFIENNNLKSIMNSIELSEEELNDIYKVPQPIEKIIELKLFDIKNFNPKTQIQAKNSLFIMKSIDNNIVFISGSKILIYNQKNFFLDEEIDINKNHPKAIINCLFQMKNQNFLCATNFGDIIIFEKDSEFEEYKEVDTICLKAEIYKIDKFFPNSICVLSKNNLVLYNENLTGPVQVKLPFQIYTNFVQISEDNLALLSDDHLSIIKLRDDKLEEISSYNDIKSNNLRNVLILTKKYIIIGGKKYIYYIDYNKNIKNKDHYYKYINGEINYIQKVHDESFLAATNEGKILHATIDNNNLEIVERYFQVSPINSLFLKNYRTILFTDKNSIQLWNCPNDEGYCNIF